MPSEFRCQWALRQPVSLRDGTTCGCRKNRTLLRALLKDTFSALESSFVVAVEHATAGLGLLRDSHQLRSARMVGAPCYDNSRVSQTRCKVSVRKENGPLLD